MREKPKAQLHDDSTTQTKVSFWRKNLGNSLKQKHKKDPKLERLANQCYRLMGEESSELFVNTIINSGLSDHQKELFFLTYGDELIKVACQKKNIDVLKSLLDLMPEEHVNTLLALKDYAIFRRFISQRTTLEEHGLYDPEHYGPHRIEQLACFMRIAPDIVKAFLSTDAGRKVDFQVEYQKAANLLEARRSLVK